MVKYNLLSDFTHHWFHAKWVVSYENAHFDQVWAKMHILGKLHFFPSKYTLNLSKIYTENNTGQITSAAALL